MIKDYIDYQYHDITKIVSISMRLICICTIHSDYKFESLELIFVLCVI